MYIAFICIAGTRKTLKISESKKKDSKEPFFHKILNNSRAFPHL